MTKRTKKQTIMREPWVGAIVAFFLFLAADPLQISTLKVQAQVMIMEDGCIFDPVWYCSEYPQGAGAREFAEKPKRRPKMPGKKAAQRTFRRRKKSMCRKKRNPKRIRKASLRRE